METLLLCHIHTFSSFSHLGSFWNKRVFCLYFITHWGKIRFSCSIFCNPNKSIFFFKWKLFSRKISLNHFSLQEANYRKMLWRIFTKYKKEDKDMKPIFLYLLFMLLSSFGVWGLTEFMLVKHQRLRPNVTSMPESDRVKRSDWHFLPLSLHSTALKQCTTFQTFNFCPKITLGQNLPYKLILIIDPKFNENSFKAKLRIFQRFDQSRFSGEKWISKTMCWFFLIIFESLLDHCVVF